MPAQRDVVEVSFRLPHDGRLENHPVIVLSNKEINDSEGGFIAVMMTSQPKHRGDDYSFDLEENMFTKNLIKPYSSARLHLIGNFVEADILSNGHKGNQMKTEAFKRLLVHINLITFHLKIKDYE